jgi:hypothetical protein
MIKALQSERPPFRLALGRAAVERIRAEMAAQLHDLDTWADVAIGADFPNRS